MSLLSFSRELGAAGQDLGGSKMINDLGRAKSNAEIIDSHACEAGGLR